MKTKKRSGRLLKYTLISLGCLLLAGWLASVVIVPRMSAPKTVPVVKPPVYVPPSLHLDEGELYRLVNAERQKRGLEPLSLNPSLNQSALNKCNDMVAKDYYEHTSPEGRTPWYFIAPATSYLAAGENLNLGHGSADKVVESWMGSEGHRRSILDTRWTDVGYAVCIGKHNGSVGDYTYIVQHFIQK